MSNKLFVMLLVWKELKLLAFDPDYASNGFFYLYYSASDPRRVVVSRWRVAGAAVAGTAVVPAG